MFSLNIALVFCSFIWILYLFLVWREVFIFLQSVRDQTQDWYMLDKHSVTEQSQVIDVLKA